MIYEINDDPLILSHFLTILACALTCQNGGTLNEATCTCDCADGYSGDTCGSEYSYACYTDLVQVHCCVAMMNWQGFELIAQH